jgi:hypothetical protein
LGHGTIRFVSLPFLLLSFPTPSLSLLPSPHSIFPPSLPLWPADSLTPTPQFFLNFSLATLVFTLYTFFSLLAFNINISSSSASSRGVGETDIDPQEVVVMAL